MMLRVPLIQIIALIGALIVASVLPVPLLGVVLAEIRLLLVMVLGVAVLYLGVLVRRDELQPAPAAVVEPWYVSGEAPPLRETERGA